MPFPDAQPPPAIRQTKENCLPKSQMLLWGFTCRALCYVVEHSPLINLLPWQIGTE